jgi:hypothetical protein
MTCKIQRAFPFLLLLFALSGACTPDAPVSWRNSSIDGNGNVERQITGVLTLHEQLLELSRDVPGFAAIYYDSSGDLVVRSTARSLSDDSRSRIRMFLQARTPRSADLELIVSRLKLVPADWDYATLAAPYEHARAVLPHHGVSSIRIDEFTNRIVIGVTDRAIVPRVQTRLIEAAVPIGLVTFEEMGPTVLDARLTDAVRPRVGGLKITNANISAPCTLGFNALKYVEGGYDFGFFLTNSHCMTVTGEVTGSVFLQPGFFGTRVGVEVENPAFVTCSAPGGKCRNADVAVVEYDDTVSSWFGTVARTPGANNLNISGYTNIQGGIEGAIAGMPVKKIGAVTGETSGTILNACVDLTVTDRGITYTLLCQQQASYARSGGDSGAPVIVVDPRYPDAPWPVGLHWGHNTATGRANLSTMNNIHADLGHGRYSVQ